MIALALLVLLSPAASFTPRTGSSIASRNVARASLLDGIFGKKSFAAPCVIGDESLMSQKAHGTSAVPVQKNLRWACDVNVADRICNFNRSSFFFKKAQALSAPYVVVANVVSEQALRRVCRILGDDAIPEVSSHRNPGGDYLLRLEHR